MPGVLLIAPWLTKLANEAVKSVSEILQVKRKLEQDAGSDTSRSERVHASGVETLTLRQVG